MLISQRCGWLREGECVTGAAMTEMGVNVNKTAVFPSPSWQA